MADSVALLTRQIVKALAGNYADGRPNNNLISSMLLSTASEKIAPVVEAAITDLLQQVQRLEASDKAVGRVWKALGISTYEQAGGKEISEIVTDRIAALAAAEATNARLVAERVETIETLNALQQELRRFSNSLPDGFNSRLLRQLDDQCAALSSSAPAFVSEPDA